MLDESSMLIVTVRYASLTVACDMLCRTCTDEVQYSLNTHKPMSRTLQGSRFSSDVAHGRTVRTGWMDIRQEAKDWGR